MITITVQLVRERERVHSFIHLILDDHLFPRHFPPRQMLKVVTFESWVLEQIGAADNGHCCCLWPVSVWHNQSQCKAVSSFESARWKWCCCLKAAMRWQLARFHQKSSAEGERNSERVKTVNGPEQSGKAQQRTHNHHHQIGTESVKVKLLLSEVSGALTCE